MVRVKHKNGRTHTDCRQLSFILFAFCVCLHNPERLWAALLRNNRQERTTNQDGKAKVSVTGWVKFETINKTALTLQMRHLFRGACICTILGYCERCCSAIKDRNESKKRMTRQRGQYKTKTQLKQTTTLRSPGKNERCCCHAAYARAFLGSSEYHCTRIKCREK